MDISQESIGVSRCCDSTAGDAKCLFAHGYVRVCRKEGRAPFATAKALFLKAFE